MGALKDITNANFGLLIAFVIPGAIVLWGLAPYSSTAHFFSTNSSFESASIAGFLYDTVASVGLGQIVSTLRWLVVDRALERSGVVQQPRIRKPKHATEAFDRMVEHHYRYYQAHANSLVALWLASPLRWVAHGFSFRGCLLLVVVSVILWLGAADTLSRYRSGLRAAMQD